MRAGILDPSAPVRLVVAVALWAVVHRPVPQLDDARHVLVGETAGVGARAPSKQPRRIVFVERPGTLALICAVPVRRHQPHEVIGQSVNPRRSTWNVLGGVLGILEQLVDERLEEGDRLGHRAEDIGPVPD